MSIIEIRYLPFLIHPQLNFKSQWKTPILITRPYRLAILTKVYINNVSHKLFINKRADSNVYVNT